MDKATVRDIAARYAEAVRTILAPDAVVIFGSYVNGSPHEHSDIDIAIICNDFKGNWYETTITLRRLSREISFDIEPHLLDENHDRMGFVDHVMKTGEYVYKAA